MKKVLSVFVVLMLAICISASAKNGKQKNAAKEINKVGMDWTITSSCGVTYTVHWNCIACLPAGYWAINSEAQEIVDSWCGVINLETGFPD